MQPTLESPAAHLPIVAITITIRHLPFKTIASVLSHTTLGNCAFKISSCHGQDTKQVCLRIPI